MFCNVTITLLRYYCLKMMYNIWSVHFILDSQAMEKKVNKYITLHSSVTSMVLNWGALYEEMNWRKKRI